MKNLFYLIIFFIEDFLDEEGIPHVVETWDVVPIDRDYDVNNDEETARLLISHGCAKWTNDPSEIDITWVKKVAVATKEQAQSWADTYRLAYQGGINLFTNEEIYNKYRNEVLCGAPRQDIN